MNYFNVKEREGGRKKETMIGDTGKIREIQGRERRRWS
jgi:hypothetical protein